VIKPILLGVYEKNHNITGIITGRERGDGTPKKKDKKGMIKKIKEEGFSGFMLGCEGSVK